MGYIDSLAHYYDMSTPVGLPDLGVVGGNPGVGANIVSNPPGMPGGQCAEFNGNNSNYNLGDVAELNAVSAFAIAFWMNQDVIDVFDYLFYKNVDADNEIRMYTGASTYVHIENAGDGYAWFDHSTVMAAGRWYHLAVVFDGSLVGDAERLRIYVNANPVPLSFFGGIPATTADLSGADFHIGLGANSFDGELDSFGIFTDPLTQLQVADHMAATRRGTL